MVQQNIVNLFISTTRLGRSSLGSPTLTSQSEEIPSWNLTASLVGFATRNRILTDLTLPGVLSIASFSYLIAITRREQVAQILGKPVYVISGVAVLPLSSQHDANKAITAAATTNLPVELNSDESS